jgi:DNA-binding response OmpR family regulator
VVKHILIVEDDGGLSNFIARTLQLAGYSTQQVSTAGDAREAFESTTVDLLLTDFSLPDGFGSDLAREFRARFPGSPIILTTGFPLDEIAVPGFSDATVILPKPFDLQALLGIVRSAVGEPAEAAPPTKGERGA